MDVSCATWLPELVVLCTAFMMCSILCIYRKAPPLPSLPLEPPQLPAPAHGMVMSTTTTTTTTRTDYMTREDWEMHIKNRKRTKLSSPEDCTAPTPTTKMTSAEKQPVGQHTPNWWPPEGDCFTYHGTPEEIREIAKKHRADRTAEKREKEEYEFMMKERAEKKKKEKDEEERKKTDQEKSEKSEKSEKPSSKSQKSTEKTTKDSE